MAQCDDSDGCDDENGSGGGVQNIVTIVTTVTCNQKTAQINEKCVTKRDIPASPVPTGDPQIEGGSSGKIQWILPEGGAESDDGI